MPIRQGGSLPNQPSTWPRRRPRRTTGSPDPSIPCTSKTFFARSRPIVLICFMDGSCCWCSITQLWHIDAVRGPSTPSWPATAGHPYVDGPPLARVEAGFDRIACDHMCGLFVRSHMTAGQDGFRDASSKQLSGVERRWVARSVSRLGLIDHTICSFSCKFRLQRVATDRSWLNLLRQRRGHKTWRHVAFTAYHQLPGDSGGFVGERHGGKLELFALQELDQPR